MTFEKYYLYVPYRVLFLTSKDRPMEMTTQPFYKIAINYSLKKKTGGATWHAVPSCKKLTWITITYEAVLVVT
jgi:hypothetical protein